MKEWVDTEKHPPVAHYVAGCWDERHDKDGTARQETIRRVKLDLFWNLSKRVSSGDQVRFTFRENIRELRDPADNKPSGIHEYTAMLCHDL